MMVFYHQISLIQMFLKLMAKNIFDMFLITLIEIF